MHYLRDLLGILIESKGSDLHLSAGQVPLSRIDGELIPMADKKILSSDDVETILKEIMGVDEWKKFTETSDADFSIVVDNLARFRVNAFKHNSGYAAVFRVIPAQVASMDELGLGSVFKEICANPRGLVLVTGPTGSGKSTTLAAMIDYINSNRKEHILTIEDPIEFVHKNKLGLVSQREVKRDTESFATALKASLREDPDIILVGEMRDLETIRLALTAAETGHLVFGTLHTTSAVKTIDRILDVFPAEEKEMVRTMLSESLQAVISQALIRKKGGGRVAAHEIMIGNQPIRNLIRENKTSQMYSTIQTGSKFGMQTLDQALKGLVSQRTISLDCARAIAHQPDQFQ